MLNRVAPLDASGKPDGRRALSDADRKAVIDGLLAACDGADGLRDGIVSDPIGCRFDPASAGLRGREGGRLPVAGAGRGSRARRSPARRTRRAAGLPGFLFDTGIAATQGLPGLLAGSMNPVGPPFTATEMDVDERAEHAAADPQAQLTSTSSWTNLSTFSSRGGKLLFYHGVSDPWFSALDTVDYYERMAPRERRRLRRHATGAGSSSCPGWATAAAARRRSTPSTCWARSSTGSRTRTPRRPSGPPAASWPGRSRPLCPYPSHAHYKGTGDVEDAGSFECR